MGLGYSSHPRNVKAEESSDEVTVVNMETDKLKEKKIQGLTRLLAVENSKRKLADENNFEHYKDNMGLLKQLFKKMDPSVTRTTTFKSHGDLELSFKYDQNKQVLLVKVIRARELDAKDLRGKSADAYVKLALLPASDQETKRTKAVERTLNPEFNEIFAFDVEKSKLNSQTLAFQVWDHDMMSQDDFIGELVVPLESLNLIERQVYTGWYSLKSETDFEITGDLEITLAFEVPNTLLVTVHRGNNLTNRYDDGAPNPFVKLQIPGTQKIYETEIKTGTTSPDWQETFSFKISPEEFKYRYIVLHAIDFDDAEKNETLGQVLIELNNFDPSTGFHGKFELADLKNSARARTQVFQNTLVQEFREALVAHAAAKYPKFLFQQQNGSKMIRVRNTKARCEAKLRIINGVPMY